MLNIHVRSLLIAVQSFDHIFVSSDLSPSVHVTDIVSKAHIQACLILHAFMSRDIPLLKCAFLVYVHPIVEHNSVIWSPYTACNIDAVQVQRRFTKRLPTLRNMLYNECFKISEYT